MPVFKRSNGSRIGVLPSNLQESAARYRRAFWRARAFRFWRAGVSVGTTALALSMPLVMPTEARAQFPASFDLSTLDGTNGFVVNGIGRYDRSGFSVSGAGDVNGDGIDDLIIGTTGRGGSYVVFGNNTGFAASIDLSTLDGTNGFLLSGDGGAGISVSRAGDVNGDGIDDLIVGAPVADPDGNNNGAGKSHVVFGQDASSDGFPAIFDLDTLDGENGFTLNGIDGIPSPYPEDFFSGDGSGRSVSAAGDFNGDGIDDLTIGAPYAEPGGEFDNGESYVVFGADTGFGASVDLDALDGTNGFVLNGVEPAGLTGRSVSGAGDFNGDGFDDVIIGAPYGADCDGVSYVVFGSNSGFAASIDLDTLDGTNGFVLNGVPRAGKSGSSVSGAGDVNGDGFDDIIIGTDFSSASDNESYVVFGQDTAGGAISAILDLNTLDGTNGFLLNGIDTGNRSGGSVSGAGDVNGDGIDDLIIGATSADPAGRTNAGESYVVFGDRGGFSAIFELDTLDGTNGFVLNGVDPADGIGDSVSGAGDVNGDGIDDLIIGASDADPGGIRSAGETYVVFGRAAVPELVIGDVNQDGVIDFADIPAFIAILQAGTFLDEADINGDGVVDFSDIPPFIDALTAQ